MPPPLPFVKVLPCPRGATGMWQPGLGADYWAAGWMVGWMASFNTLEVWDYKEGVGQGRAVGVARVCKLQQLKDVQRGKFPGKI